MNAARGEDQLHLSRSAGEVGSRTEPGEGARAPGTVTRKAGQVDSVRAATAGSLRGREQSNAPLAPFTWFRVGGPAETLARPADVDDLAAFLRALSPDVPVQVIGACSNLIIRDDGLPGVTIRLARGFTTITRESDGIVAGAAAPPPPRA